MCFAALQTNIAIQLVIRVPRHHTPAVIPRAVSARFQPMSGATSPPSASRNRDKGTGLAAASFSSSRRHVISTRTEEVDVAIVGGGLCGLACAAALHKVYPDCKIKVFEQRSQPEDLDDTSPGVGGGVRLEANGLKALTAISRRLAAGVMSQGLYAQRVMLHDTDAGTLITHLHQHSPQLLHPSSRQPALVVGWSELQQLLLDQLPADTVQWGATAMNYSDSTTGGVTLNVFVKQPTEDDDDNQPDASAAHRQEKQQGDASPTRSEASRQQQRRQYRHQQSAPIPATSPFLAASQQQDDAAADGGAANLRSPSAPAAAAAAAAGSPTHSSPAAAAAAAAAVPAHPLGQSVALVEQEPPLEEHEAAAAAAELRVERVVVHAQLLVAADGPLSPIRQQLVGDGPPQFDNTLRWVGRLPGDLMSSIPGDFEAWWLGPGLAFNSHPLSNGDVAWEAQVSSSSLAAAGYAWDAASHSLMPLRLDSSPDTSPDSLGKDNADNPRQQQQQQQQQERRTAANGLAAGFQALLRVSTAAAGGSFDSARGAAAPAGEVEMQTGGVDEGSLKLASVAEAAAAAMVGEDVEGTQGMHGRPVPTKPSQALLLRLFSSFPAPVLDMIAATPPASLLESAVMTRPARALPNCLGRGGVVVLGEAAHPLRPSGQEISQAFEDAAELGAAVMACGVSRDALRRLEMRRRPRWRHIMQVSQALGACSNLGGVSLHQGLLDYTAQLYQVSFVPLRSMLPPKEPRSKQLLRLLGYSLLAWSAAAGVQALQQRGYLKKFGGKLKRQHGELQGPVGAVIGAVEEAGEAAGKILGDVSSAAVALPGGILKAAKVGAKAEKGLQHGIGSAAAAVVDIAEEAAGKDEGGSSGDGLVRGWVPPRGHGQQKNPAAKLRDAVIGRTMALGGVVSRPFTKFVRHKAVQTVADQLGAF